MGLDNLASMEAIVDVANTIDLDVRLRLVLDPAHSTLTRPKCASGAPGRP